MFVESRLTRPKNITAAQDSRYFLLEDRAETKIPQSKTNLSLWTYYSLVLALRLIETGQRNLTSLRIVGYGLFLPISLWHTPVQGQSVEPITPERPKLPQPQPLPPSNNPVDESLIAPPLPEAVIDVPGTVKVEAFEFPGSTVFSRAELNQAIAKYTNRPLSFAQLVQAANEITKLYVERGYITSGAYLPEQDLNTGKVKIQVVEGSLAEIEVNVTEGRLRQSYIRDRLTNRLDAPLNINQLQQSLQLLQLNSLVASLNAELSTGVQPGTNSLIVTVVGDNTFNLQTRLNNNRNPSIGSFERAIRIEENNLLGIGDGIYFAFNNTDGSNQYRGGYSLPINSRDGTLSFDLSLANNQIIESPFDQADIEVDSRNYDLALRQPVYQKATGQVSQELALNLNGSIRQSNTSILNESEGISPGADEDGEIRTATVAFGQEWLQRNRQEVIAARSQFNLGVDALDATVSNSEPDGQFFSWRGQLSYLRLLNQPQNNSQVGSTLLLRSELQLAADPLVPTEQFSLGGFATVRGYRQDATLTDSGFSSNAEFRLPIARFEQINSTLQLSPFLDFGTGWNADAEDAEFSTLLGTGVGLLLQSEDRLSARVDWGIPLLNTDFKNDTVQESGVYLQLEYNFFK